MGQRFRILFMLSAVVVAGGCVNDSGDGSAPADFDFTAMLEHVVDDIILPAYESFESRAAELAGASGSVQAYCDAIGTAGESDARAAAQQDWEAAMNEWQQSELWIIGPAAANGAFLRNRINAFDENLRLSTCAADQAVVLAQQPGFDISTRSVNHRGLVVLEYLLFNDDLTHTCPGQITETQNWNNLSETERKTQRCDYARLAADDTVDAAGELIAGWQPDGGNFRAEFLDPARAEESLNALSDALFYLDTHTKDLKLGVPIGIHADCGDDNCADEVESLYSRHSLANIENNLLGFQQIFSGNSGSGFDDIIVNQGYPDVAQDMSADIDAALDSVQSVREAAGSGGLYAEAAAISDTTARTQCDNAAANPGTPGNYPVCALHGHLKRITDALKTDFVTIVNVDLPDRAQSDGD